MHTAARNALQPSVATPSANHAVALLLKRHDRASADGNDILALIGPLGPAATTARPGPFERQFGRADAAFALGELALAATILAQRANPAADRLAPSFAANTDLTIDTHAFNGIGRRSVLIAPPVSAPLFRRHARRPVLRLFTRAPGDPSFHPVLTRIAMTEPALGERLAVIGENAEQAEALAAEAQAAILAGQPLPPNGNVYHAPAPLGGRLALTFTGSAAGRNWRDPGLFTFYPELIDRLRAREPAAAAIYRRLIAPGTASDDPAVHLKISSLVCQAHGILALDLLGLAPDAALGLSSGETNALIAMGIWDNLAGLLNGVDGSAMYGDWLSGHCRAAAQAWGLPDAEPVDWICWQVVGPRERVAAAMADEPRVSLTIVQAPGVHCLCGEAAAMARVMARLGDCSASRLHSDLVVHTPAMAPFADRWRQIHSRPTHTPADLSLYSNAFNAAYAPDTNSVAEALTRQALDTVDFPATVEQAWRDGVRVFIECGPRA
ncbi:MAG: hypothetical protein B7W97_00255, partial [Mycobacterium sp. 20-66-4]